MNERMTKVQHSFPILRSLSLKIYESYIFKLYFAAFNLAGCIKDMMTQGFHLRPEAARFVRSFSIHVRYLDFKI